jgi:hypothetical protein
MTITCERCKAANQEGMRFCGECGGPLDAAFGAMKEFIESTLREKIREVLRDYYKDQKVVEVETSQAVAARLLDWAKLFAFFVGIPTVLLLVLLGIFGIKTYSDFSTQIEKAQIEIATNLDAAQKRAAKLKSDGDTLIAEYEKVRSRLADTTALADRVEILDKKIVNIGDSIRSALVFGNSAYPKFGPGQQLRTSVNDARSVGNKLEELGFKVSRGENLSREEMLRRLTEFSSQLVPGDTAVLYYSGHGISISGESFLIPSDMPIEELNETKIRSNAVALSDITSLIRGTKARVAVLVFDACRNNPFSVPITRGLARLEIPGPDFFVLYSAGDGQVAFDSLGPSDNSPNSIFTRVLVNSLGKAELDLVGVARDVSQEVRRLSRSAGFEQTPAYYDSTLAPIFLAARR